MDGFDRDSDSECHSDASKENSYVQLQIEAPDVSSENWEREGYEFPDLQDLSPSLDFQPADLRLLEEEKTYRDLNIDRVEEKAGTNSRNETKNAPGLIVNRVITSIKGYWNNLNPNKVSDWDYLGRILDDRDEQWKKEFEHFLGKYNAKWKTWKTIKNYMIDGKNNGRVLKTCICTFLEEEGRADFESWVSSTKIRKSRDKVKRNKERLREGFMKKL